MAKVKIPKEVAGVKVPKALRKEAKRALELVESKAVRELALSGLSIAAQKLADRARSNLADPGHRQATISLKTELEALNLGEVLRAAAVEGARRFLAGFEEGQAAPAKSPPVNTAPKPRAAKPKAAAPKATKPKAAPKAAASKATPKAAAPKTRPAAKPARTKAAPRATTARAG